MSKLYLTLRGCKEEYSRAPFIQIKSHSSGKRYRLIIARDEAENAQAIKGFSTYGLSTESTVPLF